MTQYKRTHDCGMCNNPVIYDDKKHTLTCVGKDACVPVVRVSLAPSVLDTLFKKVKIETSVDVQELREVDIAKPEKETPE